MGVGTEFSTGKPGVLVVVSEGAGTDVGPVPDALGREIPLVDEGPEISTDDVSAMETVSDAGMLGSVLGSAGLTAVETFEEMEEAEVAMLIVVGIASTWELKEEKTLLMSEGMAPISDFTEDTMLLTADETSDLTDDKIPLTVDMPSLRSDTTDETEIIGSGNKSLGSKGAGVVDGCLLLD